MLDLLLAIVIVAGGTARKQPPPGPATSSSTDEEQVEAKNELSDDDVRQQVNAYLGAIDTPIGANQWKSLGSRAVPMLESIVTSDAELPTRRAKAIDGLAALGDKKASALFTRIAGNDGEKINVRFAAVRGLARLTPRHHAAEALQPILERAKDSRVRAVAAEQIAIRSRGESCGLVRAQLEREETGARRNYRRAMNECAIQK
jgi:hypothetical protein